MWLEHGGCGLGMSWDECQNLDVADIEDLLQRKYDRKVLESNALKQARGSK